MSGCLKVANERLGTASGPWGWRPRTLRQLLQLQAPRQRGHAQSATSATSSTRSPYRLSRHLGHHQRVHCPHLAFPSAVFCRHCARTPCSGSWPAHNSEKSRTCILKLHA